MVDLCHEVAPGPKKSGCYRALDVPPPFTAATPSTSLASLQDALHFGDRSQGSATLHPGLKLGCAAVGMTSDAFSGFRGAICAHQDRANRDGSPSAPESAHQQWGGSPHRTEHWLSVAEGNCVAERRGGEQPEANDQSIIKKMMNSIRPDALASLLGKGEAQNGSRPAKGITATPHLSCGENSERNDRSAWGGWR